MQIENIVIEVSPNVFQIKQISFRDEVDKTNQIKALESSYVDPYLINSNRVNYKCGRFIVNPRGGYAYILYVNEASNTRTYVAWHDDVNNLEDIVLLMNKYANLNAEEIFLLMESMINRLGIYRRHFISNKDFDFTLESGYYHDSLDKLGTFDFDKSCIRDMQASTRAAAELYRQTMLLHKLSNQLNHDSSDILLNKIKETINHAYHICKTEEPRLVYNGKRGNDILIGFYGLL